MAQRGARLLGLRFGENLGRNVSKHHCHIATNIRARIVEHGDKDRYGWSAVRSKHLQHTNGIQTNCSWTVGRERKKAGDCLRTNVCQSGDTPLRPPWVGSGLCQLNQLGKCRPSLGSEKIENQRGKVCAQFMFRIEAVTQPGRNMSRERHELISQGRTFVAEPTEAGRKGIVTDGSDGFLRFLRRMPSELVQLIEPFAQGFVFVSGFGLGVAIEEKQKPGDERDGAPDGEQQAFEFPGFHRWSVAQRQMVSTAESRSSIRSSTSPKGAPGGSRPTFNRR